MLGDVPLEVRGPFPAEELDNSQRLKAARSSAAYSHYTSVEVESKQEGYQIARLLLHDWRLS